MEMRRSNIFSRHKDVRRESYRNGASIPSGYRTVVNRVGGKKGFGSCINRFNSGKSLANNPCPTKYQPRTLSSIQENVSLSNRGLGTGFASKEDRFRYITKSIREGNCLGPGQYYDSSRETSVAGNRSFSRAGCSGNFHKPIVEPSNHKQPNAPGPGEYSIAKSISKSGRVYCNRNVAARVAFLSKSAREMQGGNCSAPSPSHYVQDDSAVQPSPRSARSCFQSTTPRESSCPNAAASKQHTPGPGSYQLNHHPKPQEKATPVRKQFFRMSAVLQRPTGADSYMPGPGHYNIAEDSTSSTTKQRSENRMTHVFASQTQRYPGDSLCDLPGPAEYSPKRANTSYIYNASKRWI